MLCNFGAGNWLETYFACQVRPGSTLLGAYLEIWPQVKELMPHNAWEICTDRLFISVTEVTPWGLRNRVISKYSSNDDIFQACCASSCIPYVTTPRLYWNLTCETENGRETLCCLDGGITNNTPVFPDGTNRQLVFRLFEIEYPWRQTVNPIDTCIETLCLRGAILMSRFLQGEPTDSIQWLDKKEKKDALLVKKNYFGRLVILPFVIGGLILGQGTGLSALLRGIFKGKGNIDTVVVPFAQAGKMYGTSTIRYIGTVLFTTLIDGLRSLQLLL